MHGQLVSNLSSVKLNPDIVCSKILKEVELGRVSGPFKSPPFPNLVISPLGLVPKKSPGQFRLIHHLSYPPNSSVNNGIPDSLSTVSYASLHQAMITISTLGIGCYLSKTDIQSAFRLIPLSPQEHYLLGFTFEGLYYYDRNLPMGLRSSCQIFEYFSSSLEWIAKYKLSIPHVLHVLDDFLFISSSQLECQNSLDKLISMCGHIGVPIAQDKTQNSTQILTFLGIEIDTTLMQVRLPTDKVHKCITAIQQMLSQKKATLKQIQQLSGLLNFATQVVIPGRPFLRRIHELTIGLTHPFQHVHINSQARLDLLAWLQFLRSFNGKSIWLSSPFISYPHLDLYTDSSGSIGYGSLFGSNWFNGEWSQNWQSKHITILELYPIVASIALWSSRLANKHLSIHTDNISLTYIINNMYSKDKEVMVLIRKLVVSCMSFNIHIRAHHIPGKYNILCDLLSRQQVSKFKSLAPWASPTPTQVPCQLLPHSLLPP